MLRFTLRDWIWFCIVMALAIGWGSHVRYTLYTARLHQIDRPQKLDEAVSDYHKLIEEKYENAKTLRELVKQINELETTTEQREDMNRTLQKMKVGAGPP